MTASHVLNSAITTTTAPKAASKADIRTGAFLSALLGVSMIFAVGFSHIDVFHNAAHDTRHSNAFPCH
jgi:cobalt transporter subunit CbtB